VALEKAWKEERRLHSQPEAFLDNMAFSGNKAWKLDYYLTTHFQNTSKIISYGSAQSNMLHSLSVLAKLKGWALDFYVDHIASHLKAQPAGNYAEACRNGANIIEVKAKERGDKNTEHFVLNHVLPSEPEALYIPEGGRHGHSEQGIKKAAEQIANWVRTTEIHQPKLVLPSGTGTTALFLQKHLPFEVLTCACVGSSGYLKEQCASVVHEEVRNNEQRVDPEKHRPIYPTILPQLKDPQGRIKTYHFGKLYSECYQIWQDLKEQTGIEFDLLYDPLGWLSLLQYMSNQELDQTDYIYLHQGGLGGNKTMLSRYKRAELKTFNPMTR